MRRFPRKIVKDTLSLAPLPSLISRKFLRVFLAARLAKFNRTVITKNNEEGA